MIDFSDSDYKSIIQKTMANLKGYKSHHSYSEMARVTRTQKTYISRVLNAETGHFSRDQLFAICEYLGFSNQETDFCLLLLDAETCHNRHRKKLIKQQIRRVQDAHLKTKNFLQTDLYAPSEQVQDRRLAYYLDPNAILMHMLLTIDTYRQNPMRMGEVLGLSRERLASLLTLLHNAGIIHWQESTNSLALLVERQHLDAENWLTPAHQALMRLKCLEHCLKISSDKRYSLAVTFSASEAVKAQIQKTLLDTVRDIEDLVAAAPAETLYQVNIDLFPWL